jgi:hypothetical protein
MSPTPADKAVQDIAKRVDAVADGLEARFGVGGNSSSTVHIHGNAPAWTAANVALTVVALAVGAIVIALYTTTSDRISDLQARIDADSIKLEMYKTSNDERARTDRILYGKLAERTTQLEQQQ